MTRLALGFMTGTSIDAIDAALVRIEGSGWDTRPTFLRGLSRPLSALAEPLRALASGAAMTARELATLSRDFSLLHAQTGRELLGSDRADFACAHGQTVFHAPPVSWQLFSPAVLAAELNTPVVSDLRAMDLALGGQGAPITPIADLFFFRSLLSPEAPTAIVNLGGFANITLLPAATGGEPIQTLAPRVRARDVCVCNQLLDELARRLLHAPYDADGAAALRGSIHDEALEDLEGILHARSASNSPRSLGTGDEAFDWISRFRARVSADDLCATACEAIGSLVAHACPDASRILLAGGGAHNRALSRAIASASTALVAPLDAHGLPGAFREAAEFALLGALCADRVSITLPAVTGVTAAPLSGTFTPAPFVPSANNQP